MSKSQNETPVQIRIGSSNQGRLDKFLAQEYPDLSRSYFQRLINGRFVTVDGHPASPHHKLKMGQLLLIQWPSKIKAKPSAKEEPLPFPVLFEDNDLLVINKPAGLLCHPAGSRQTSPTLVDLLVPRVQQYEWPEGVRPGLVHRLDRDTSGVLVYAKTPEAHAKLSKQFADRQVKKTYFALVRGILTPKEGTIECVLGRHPQKRQRFTVSDAGRWASTAFKVVEVFGLEASLVELHPLTGRTHQLRVQLSTYGYPILGDHIYGGVDSRFPFIRRQMLHAARLSFLHPRTQARLEFDAPWPDDLQAALKILRSQT